jgi:hypothetical protein
MIKRKHLLIALPILFVVLALFVFFQTKAKFENRVATKILDYSGKIDPKLKTAIYNGESIEIPGYVFEERLMANKVLGVSNSDKWIDVDLTEQKLRAWEGNNLFLETLISSGLPFTPTPQGEFNIWIKLRATRMEGGQGKYYYNLPNVPYVMFFESAKLPRWLGYGLHGTYWHNDFGNPHSHGCVNLPTPIAEKLYYWTTPDLPQGKTMVYASADNPGTRIVIHD